MMTLCCEVLRALRGRTLATAESLTGGGIGAAITGVPGSSAIFKGGIISYTDSVKCEILGVDSAVLEGLGAVSQPVAMAMAAGARRVIGADVAVAVTGLAGPEGDSFGNPVGTVFIGYCDADICLARRYEFSGDREQVRGQTIAAALRLILEMQ